MTSIPFYNAADVEAHFDIPGGISAMRDAMIALSAGGEQPHRQIVNLAAGGLFASMPGELAAAGMFGAKLVSVFGSAEHAGRSRHRGVVAAFDAASGALACLADAEAVTTLRTACATAAATDALARRDATSLAVFGSGTQALAHVLAVSKVRDFREIRVWGRCRERAAALVSRLSDEYGIEAVAVADGRDAATGADVLCTVTSAAEPILAYRWLRPGAHVNLVGSSYLGPVEVDAELVAAGRYVVDYRPSALAQAAELAVARAEGLVDDTHIAAEIGEVFAGDVEGRQGADQLTIYKSLGHVAQDLAAAAYVHRQIISKGAKL